ncbi:MAG: hypothetical protein AB7L91_11110 [Dehalococcoidia bacterium]
MAYECRRITAIVTQVLNSEAGAAEFRALMDSNASSAEVVDAFTQHCTAVEGDLMRAEFAELPRSFVGTFMDAWYMANEQGLPFVLASEPPARPLEFARNGRVGFRLEHDVHGVTMYVSHVHGRHADWFKPAAATVA